MLAQAPANSISRTMLPDIQRGGTWNYLPGTLTEVEAIAKIAKGRKITAQAFTGTQASEAQYKTQSGKQSPNVLHIASHGFFFPDPMQSHTAPGDKLAYRTSDNPLHRSGILFAGANHTWQGEPVPEGSEDGILTAYEAANTILSSTQLVVLSACETGLGDIKGSEGVFGLQRAFKAAGAEYLLMSLWKVPDKETAEFMTYFYDTWFSGTTIPDAFRKTQQYMKAKYPGDPYKWAAFVLVR